MIFDCLKDRFARLQPVLCSPEDLKQPKGKVAKARHWYFPRTGELVLPKERTPRNVFGKFSMQSFLLPALCVAMENPESCVLLADTYADQIGLTNMRWFMYVRLTDAEKSVIPPFKDQRALYEHLKMLEFFDGTLTCIWGYVTRISYRKSGSGAGITPIASAILDESGHMMVRELNDLTSDEGDYLVSQVITAHEEIGFLRNIGAITIVDDPVMRTCATSDRYRELIMPRLPDDYFSVGDVERLRAAYNRGVLLRREMEQKRPDLLRPPSDGLTEVN